MLSSGNGRHRRPRQAIRRHGDCRGDRRRDGARHLRCGAARVAAVHAAERPGEPNVWDKVALCESGGVWSANTGNGFYGGLQITQELLGPVRRPASTPQRPTSPARPSRYPSPRRSWTTLGPDAWPSCADSSGLTSRAPERRPGRRRRRDRTHRPVGHRNGLATPAPPTGNGTTANGTPRTPPPTGDTATPSLAVPRRLRRLRHASDDAPASAHAPPAHPDGRDGGPSSPPSPSTARPSVRRHPRDAAPGGTGRRERPRGQVRRRRHTSQRHHATNAATAPPQTRALHASATGTRCAASPPRQNVRRRLGARSTRPTRRVIG